MPKKREQPTIAHPGSCAAGCRYWCKPVNDDQGLPVLIPASDPARGGKPTCTHPKREAHWQVPMAGNCFWHNYDDEEAHRENDSAAQPARCATQLSF